MITTIQTTLALIITFLGLFVGLFIAFFTKEELKQGARYFILLQRVIPILALVLLAVFLRNIYVFLIIIVFFLLYLFAFGRYKKLLYWALAVIFFIYMANKTLFLINALLIFIYGLAEGSLYYSANQKRSKKDLFFGLFKQHYPFLVIALVLLAISLL